MVSTSVTRADDKFWQQCEAKPTLNFQSMLFRRFEIWKFWSFLLNDACGELANFS